MMRPGKRVMAVAAFAVVAAIVAIIVPVASSQDADRLCTLGKGVQKPAARDVGVLRVWDEPCALPDGITFTDGAGKALTLKDFAGKTVVLNLWATWCPPCLNEMPALDRLQAAMGGETFTVVALNQDRGGAEVARTWLADKGLGLDVYADPTGSVARALEAAGLPTTVVIDAQGFERARLIGEAEWDSAEMQEKLRGLMTSR
ncbi:TlpA family protein disulfide reductase [Novispirillum sp. DQ9]|uniref:TlpA family protein disulfide reductase n=1 Tax=Novispirillum sp. DQ9 TaxID=3398612 RepID=UPI003C7AB4FA